MVVLESVEAVVVIRLVMLVVVLVGDGSHFFSSRNMGRVSRQKVIMETMMTDMEMMATTRAGRL